MSLDDKLDAWVAADLIDQEQATSIRLHEAAPDAGGSGRDVLAYLGSVLVLAAALVVTAEVWPDLDSTGQAFVAGIAAVLLTVAGLALVRSTQASTHRVGSATLLLGAVAVGATGGVLVDASADSTSWSAAVGFGAAAVYATFFYARQQTVAQHVALFGSLFGFVLALFASPFDIDEGVVADGIAAVAFGVGWLALSSSGRLVPRLTGEVLGLLAVGIGSMMIVTSFDTAEASGRVAMLACVVGAALLVAFGVMRDRIVYIIGGVLLMLVYLPWLVNEVLGDGLGAPFALLAAGAMLIGTAVYLNRRARG